MVFERVQRIMSDLFGLPLEQISACTSPEDISSWDSVQNLNLILALEQAFTVQFEPEEFDRMRNVGEIVGVLGSKLGGSA